MLALTGSARSRLNHSVDRSYQLARRQNVGGDGETRKSFGEEEIEDMCGHERYV